MSWGLLRYYVNYSDEKIRELNPISIAYVGDCVYELYVRSYLMLKFGNINSNKIHLEAIKYVNSKAQKIVYFKIKDRLTEIENLYFKKGRNTKIKTIPKNSSVSDYRISTGLETVVGYLYITGNFDRLDFIMNNILGIFEEILF